MSWAKDGDGKHVIQNNGSPFSFLSDCKNKLNIANTCHGIEMPKDLQLHKVLREVVYIRTTRSSEKKIHFLGENQNGCWLDDDFQYRLFHYLDDPSLEYNVRRATVSIQVLEEAEQQQMPVELWEVHIEGLSALPLFEVYHTTLPPNEESNVPLFAKRVLCSWLVREPAKRQFWQWLHSSQQSVYEFDDVFFQGDNFIGTGRGTCSDDSVVCFPIFTDDNDPGPMRT
jgi:hypothetical protein